MEATVSLPMNKPGKTSVSGVVKEFGKRLFGFIRTRVRTDEDAEDILQDVWYQLSANAALESVEEIGSWLYTVARNKITDKYRKKKTDLLEDYAYEDEDGDVFFRTVLFADNNTPETENIRKLIWDRIFDALDEIPEKQRTVFVQNEIEGKTLQEIADASGENLKTIISRKRYAVAALRTRLQELYDDITSG